MHISICQLVHTTVFLWDLMVFFPQKVIENQKHSNEVPISLPEDMQLNLLIMQYWIKSIFVFVMLLTVQLAIIWMSWTTCKLVIRIMIIR